VHKYLAVIFFCQFHLFIATFLGNIDTKSALCRKMLDESLERYPDSVIFQTLNARYYLVQVRYKLSVNYST
jgi:hypothetical protein